ncbi:MAG: hypothetical protein QM650_14400 [Microlunatus sp.]
MAYYVIVTDFTPMGVSAYGIDSPGWLTQFSLYGPFSDETTADNYARGFPATKSGEFGLEVRSLARAVSAQGPSGNGTYFAVVMRWDVASLAPSVYGPFPNESERDTYLEKVPHLQQYDYIYGCQEP